MVLNENVPEFWNVFFTHDSLYEISAFIEADWVLNQRQAINKANDNVPFNSHMPTSTKNYM